MRSSKAKHYCSVAVSRNIQKQVRKIDQIEEKICFPSKTSSQFSVFYSPFHPSQSIFMWHLEGKLSVTPLKGNCCGTWVKVKSEGALTFTAIIIATG